MHNLKKILILPLLFCLALAANAAGNASSKSFANETLHYKVMYKWGLINKQAGTATLTLKGTPDRYKLLLTAASAPWADHIYRVRDTLSGEISRVDLRPHVYTKRAHEKNERKLDQVHFRYDNGLVTGHCTRVKWDKKGRKVRDEKRELQSNGTTVDMLSSFFYMRALPYDSWKSGHSHTITIFSGKEKETLTIKYMGVTEVEVNRKKHKAYHIRFVFTGKGGKKTSDDMDAWISTAATRIPLRLEGKLPVGKVQCILTN